MLRLFDKDEETQEEIPFIPRSTFFNTLLKENQITLQKLQQTLTRSHPGYKCPSASSQQCAVLKKTGLVLARGSAVALISAKDCLQVLKVLKFKEGLISSFKTSVVDAKRRVKQN